MTSRELLRLLLRRWYLMLLGAAASVAVLLQVWQQPGVHWTQFDIVLLGPRNEKMPNNIEDPRHAITPMAGMLVTEFNGEHRPRQLASSATTLYGEGIEHGHRVRLPNMGSQWLPHYGQPVIDVQVVDPDPRIVAAEAERISEELASLLDRHQDKLNIVPTMRMSMMVSPPEPVVAYISTSRSRAALATGLVGATLTTVLVYWHEQWRLRRRRRHRDRDHDDQWPSMPEVTGAGTSPRGRSLRRRTRAEQVQV